MDGGPDKENRRVEIYGVRTVVGQNVAPPAEVDGAPHTPILILRPSSFESDFREKSETKLSKLSFNIKIGVRGRHHLRSGATFRLTTVALIG